jgi:hypothetical protein
MWASISCRKIRLAATSCFSGASGDKPAAIRSALIKFWQLATLGKYSRAKVVLPAPLGPAMIQQIGISLIPFPSYKTFLFKTSY